MFGGFDKLTRQAFVAQRPRSRVLSVATIALVFAVVATAIVGFVHVSTQQRVMTDLRAQGLQLRAMYQSQT